MLDAYAATPQKVTLKQHFALKYPEFDRQDFQARLILTKYKSKINLR